MNPAHIELPNSASSGELKRLHYPLEVMLVYVRCYTAYPLSLRNLEKLMAKRGVRLAPCHCAQVHMINKGQMLFYSLAAWPAFLA